MRREPHYLEAGRAHHPGQLAQRERAGVRRVAQPLELVVVRRALGLFAGDQILDRHQPVVAAHARHLGDHLLRRGEMMNRKPAHDDVEFAVVERQARLDVAILEADVGQSTLDTHLLGNLERRFGQIDSDDFAAHRRKCHRDMPRPGGDFQHARIRRRRDNLDQLAQMLGVENRGRGRVVVRLPGEFFADEIFVFHIERAGNYCRGSRARIKRAGRILRRFPALARPKALMVPETWI